MRAWQIDGIWEHKNGTEAHFSFIVVSPKHKNSDPMKILRDQYDFNGDMTYKMGKVVEINIEAVFCTHASEYIPKQS